VSETEIQSQFSLATIKAVVGLGNPGARFEATRHNVGFMLLDRLGECYGTSWQERGNALEATIQHPAGADAVRGSLKLLKPQTFMNDSGKALSGLSKDGVKPSEILVVHDELEKPLGHVSTRLGGSARGHNGLKSIIGNIGYDFWRLRIGISRPDDRDDVSDYVLQPFSLQEAQALGDVLEDALRLILPS
jgi:peptidyl-tRNA hydrolase, PTH1 family